MQLETKGVMTGLTRLMNSPSGNPRWMVHLNSGSWRTEEDSQCGYQLSEAMVGQVVELTIEHGKVRQVDLEPECTCGHPNNPAKFHAGDCPMVSPESAFKPGHPRHNPATVRP